jgi:mono/diheme cytochrome c family protein
MNQDTYMVQLLDFSRGLEALPRTSLRDFGVDRSSAMPSYKGKLSEDELNDVVSYLASLKEKPE